MCVGKTYFFHILLVIFLRIFWMGGAKEAAAEALSAWFAGRGDGNAQHSGV